MASERIDVEVTGKSMFEVAHTMALQMLQMEGKTPAKATREEYLKAHYDAIMVLRGSRPA
jgi:hypothetical protein